MRAGRRVRRRCGGRQDGRRITQLSKLGAASLGPPYKPSTNFPAPLSTSYTNPPHPPLPHPNPSPSPQQPARARRSEVSEKRDEVGGIGQSMQFASFNTPRVVYARLFGVVKIWLHSGLCNAE